MQKKTSILQNYHQKPKNVQIRRYENHSDCNLDDTFILIYIKIVRFFHLFQTAKIKTEIKSIRKEGVVLWTGRFICHHTLLAKIKAKRVTHSVFTRNVFIWFLHTNILFVLFSF